MKPLYKTTIIVWTDYDPAGRGASEIVEQSEIGDAYCSLQRTNYVGNPESDNDWDGTEFFYSKEDDENDND